MKKTNDVSRPRSFRKKLSHLRALRAFEAVACHLSFTRAAEELAVSQGAISHQVKLLEERLGKRLFLRGGKGVTLTVEGELLNEVCRRSFDEIGETLSLIGQKRDAQILRVRSGPFFAMKVIAPRISEFLSANPGIQLHLNNLDPDSASLGSEDVLIKYCMDPPANSVAAEILKENLVLICNPDLLADGGDLADILVRSDVARLHYRDMGDWESWLDQFGFGAAPVSQNLIFDDQHTILEAVRSGQGIGMAERSLIQGDVARGRIAILSDLCLRPEASYKFIYKADRAASHRVIEVFHDWLRDQVERIQGDSR
ncbi:LysR family transcriptional regulator [Roseovarius spongiae]|uniref:LysR family transcriptional regulator n=1 Tax=Roseovarius spongiae TaxID=2320272 RepID=A0A3A8BBX6_9RHOB|nr:LysR family transcriptional regulator [Roseovarius spongiae]RKF17002.1 LysR family transcriptional regulator [Roseovarius spongiae]